MAEQLWDVVAVNIETGAERWIARGKSERDAEAIQHMAVIRRGVEEEFFKLLPSNDGAPGEEVMDQPTHLTVASKYGKYDMHNDLQMAAACIRDLAERIDGAAQLAERLQRNVEEMQRRARAALESFS